jgi:hypothetical protein
MVTIVCEICGKEMKVYPCRVGRQKFCGMECRNKNLSTNIRGENHPMFGRKHTPKSLEIMRAKGIASAKRGSASTHWTGGRYKSRGYVMVAFSSLTAEEQRLFAPMAGRSLSRAIPEHRLIMAKSLGRPLRRDEVVHHRNGVKDDNRIENLEPLDNSTHTAEHKAIIKELRQLRMENELLRLEIEKLKQVG